MVERERASRDFFIAEMEKKCWEEKRGNAGRHHHLAIDVARPVSLMMYVRQTQIEVQRARYRTKAFPACARAGMNKAEGLLL